jgi:hypothetical protein
MDGFDINKDEKSVVLDLNYISDVVQKILDSAHTNVQKRRIVIRPHETTPKELNFACPICGDSHNRMNMKRGHLFLRNMNFVCYNEKESCSRPFVKFCEHFNIQIDPDKKMQIYDYINQNISFSSKEDFALDTLDKLINAKEFMDYLNNRKGSFLTNISPIKKNSLAFTYLINRKITNFTNIMQGIYNITEKWKEPVIIILNRSGNKLLGFQIRNLRDEKDKRIYHEKEFEFLYNYKNFDNRLDELEAISYNKLSHLFNILNINFDLPVHAFEGYLDSVFFPNSMSLLGLDTDISIINNDSIDLRFVFDNDEPGIRKAKKMLEQGKTVFLWRKLYDDLSKGDYIYRNELNKIKDINRLVQFLDNSNIYYDLNLEKYFSKDRFDMIYLEDKPRNKKSTGKPSLNTEWDNIVL